MIISNNWVYHAQLLHLLGIWTQPEVFYHIICIHPGMTHSCKHSPLILFEFIIEILAYITEIANFL